MSNNKIKNILYFLSLIIGCIGRSMEKEHSMPLFFIPCEQYQHHAPVESEIYGHTVISPFPYKEAPDNTLFVPENCLAEIPKGFYAATFPLSPCIGMVATNYQAPQHSIESTQKTYTTIFAHITHRTNQQSVNNWIYHFFEKDKPENITIKLYSTINNSFDFQQLHQKKAQIDRLIDRTHRIQGGLGIPQKNITVDLINDNNNVIFTQIIAEHLGCDPSEIQNFKQHKKKTQYELNKIASDISCLPRSLLIDPTGQLYTTLPSQIYNQTQRCLIEEKSNNTKKFKLLNIPNNRLSSVVGKIKNISWEEDKNNLYKISLALTTTN